MSYTEILILAIIQGLAELLPVSSSAHVIVAAKLLGQDTSSVEFVFLLVMLHTGTMFAVLIYFWPRWKKLLLVRPAPLGPVPVILPPRRMKEVAANPPAPSGLLATPRRHEPLTGWDFVKLVVVATALTVGLAYGLQKLIENVIIHGKIEELFKNLPLIGTSLFLVGLMIVAAGFCEIRFAPNPLTLRTALLIGLIQGLTLPFRGFSRSGSTISTGLFCGLSRQLAEDFSFALALALTPAVFVRQLQKLLEVYNPKTGPSLLELMTPGLVGMGFSFVAGLLALKVLSAVLEAGRWAWFGVYCILASGGVFAVWYYGL
jgi:undecaprenyl-diphosphatase